MKSTLCIHIGYHKTGTTFLQTCVFQGPKSPFLCPWGGQSALAVEQFVLANPFRFDAAAARRHFAHGIEEGVATGRPVIISHEALSGHPAAGRYYSREVADRLHATFPDARILIGIREQRSMVLSVFQQHVRRGGCETLPQLIGTGHEPTGFAPVCRLDFFEYDALVGYYIKLFGRDQVAVLPIELLRSDFAAYLEIIKQTAGLRSLPHVDNNACNVGYSGLTVAARRRINACLHVAGRRKVLAGRMANRFSAILDRVTPRGMHDRIESRWRRFIAERVGDRYRSSNQILSDMTGFDLKAIGYDA